MLTVKGEGNVASIFGVSFVMTLPRPRAAKSRAIPATPSASGRFGVIAISITGSFRSA